MNDQQQQQQQLPSESILNRRTESMKNPTGSSSTPSSSPVSPSESSLVLNNNNNNNNHLNTATISDMFISIDGRLQKLQDQMIYHRSMNNYGINSPTSFPSYMNMMKTQFLSMENLVESKLSTIENKFSNIVIEDEIWKKTINWKVEEILSKVWHEFNF
ncbi:hypothetical protein BLA29_010470 [Euroglyphus maynei]|uniref:Uncharacterized protein n=1 Tax=Euroglyphus maynei TaxID=6958 RepID=A0A1Y3AN23_EURMA|nr:hypothetical protein BLA29_010470 [Euroglyphus maynei]